MEQEIKKLIDRYYGTSRPIRLRQGVFDFIKHYQQELLQILTEKEGPREVQEEPHTCIWYPDDCNPSNCEFWYDDCCDHRRKKMRQCSRQKETSSCRLDTCQFYYYSKCEHRKDL